MSTNRLAELPLAFFFHLLPEFAMDSDKEGPSAINLNLLDDLVDEPRLDDLESSVTKLLPNGATRINRRRTQILHGEAFRLDVVQPSTIHLTPSDVHVIHVKAKKIFIFMVLESSRRRTH